MGKKLLIAAILIISLVSGCMEKPETGVKPVPTHTVKPTESTHDFEVIPQKEVENGSVKILDGVTNMSEITTPVTTPLI